MPSQSREGITREIMGGEKTLSGNQELSSLVPGDLAKITKIKVPTLRGVLSKLILTLLDGLLITFNRLS